MHFLCRCLLILLPPSDDHVFALAVLEPVGPGAPGGREGRRRETPTLGLGEDAQHPSTVVGPDFRKERKPGKEALADAADKTWVWKSEGKGGEGKE